MKLKTREFRGVEFYYSVSRTSEVTSTIRVWRKDTGQGPAITTCKPKNVKAARRKLMKSYIH